MEDNVRSTTRRTKKLVRSISIGLILIAAGYRAYKTPLTRSSASTAKQATANANVMTVTINFPRIRQSYKALFPIVQKERHLPFREPLCGTICLDASIGGKRQECIWDTGTTGVTVPRSLHLCGHVACNHPWPLQDTGGIHVQSEILLLPEIRIGDYSIKNLPAFAVAGDSKFLAPRVNRTALLHSGYAVPILGSEIFIQTAVTVDWDHHQLILHDRRYNAAQQAHKPGTRLIDFNYDGYIVMHGRIAGRPARIILDTGNYGDGLLVSRSFQQKHLRGLHGKKDIQPTGFGSALMEHLKPMDWAVGDFRQTSLVTVSQLAGEDASVGLSAFNDYQVTIDFPHRKILLVPYDNGDSKG